MTDFIFTGKQGKQFVITDGIRTRYLTAKEFTAWVRQHMGR